MAESSDWNVATIEEFRANEGRVGGPFEGAPMVLVHHRGRKSGREYVTPVMYLPHAFSERQAMYVFATKGGAPTHPDWYYNLVSAGEGSVEVGTDSRSPSVSWRVLSVTVCTPSRPVDTQALPPTSGRRLVSAPSPCSSSCAPRLRRRAPVARATWRVDSSS